MQKIPKHTQKQYFYSTAWARTAGRILPLGIFDRMGNSLKNSVSGSIGPHGQIQLEEFCIWVYLTAWASTA
jgi:hypothetical protein